MAKPEQGRHAPDEGAQEEKSLTPLERVRKAVREAEERARESGTKESKNLGEALELAGLLENLIQYIEKNPGTKEATELESMLLGYANIQRGLKAREKDKGKTEEELNLQVGDWRSYDELKRNEGKIVKEIMELAKKLESGQSEENKQFLS